MIEMDWLAVGSAVAAALALVANIISAAGAARSADVAGAAERRIGESEALAALRELKRTAAQVNVEATTLNELCDLSVGTRRGLGTITGHAGGGLEAEAFERYDAWRSVAAGAKQKCDGLPTEGLAMHDRQLALDEALIHVRSGKEAALRELDDMQRERARTLAARVPPGRGS